MDVVHRLAGLYPDLRVFQTNHAIKVRKLYHDVMRIVADAIAENMNDFNQLAQSQNVNEHLIRIGVLYDLVYGNLHTGEWHAVPVEEREVFTILSYFRILYSLLCARESSESIKNAIYIADIGIMLGAKVFFDCKGMDKDLLTEVASVLSSAKQLENQNEPPLKRIKIDSDDTQDVTCEIPCLHRPTLEYFGSEHYDKSEPALLRGIIDDWPAMQKWHDLEYLVGLAGERTVPVEIGSQYSSDDWSQRLVKFRDFIVTNLTETSKDGPDDQNGVKRAYLAQHELFDQIPELRKDIFVPDYIGRTDVSPRIKAWLGPKGTISPLHTDPSHNLLCQVFGSKTIILASPGDTLNLYPHEHFILNNTSQVDAKHLDFDRFPLAREVRFRQLVLRRGDILYIPPGWWHYVESLEPSFSVSFWFD
ncbi:bifunctional peptidase and arginyl-hydroxylase JMJD5 isoform X2 [Toxorhynchites rutilus septentrionalis]|uniref:bifunctional peptidase and arginyl-hydroxylase JMJD5 isoform X2 n=1 Tax=Toxorhynchites rutilus septentrionalis TaxID=329112 RepID=UPI0024793805|nr:bifunctional peptidase and arginyl-hydroxylase JMJD5 isoform X2 [Toxorhynchites rutilus septentrionalis]